MKAAALFKDPDGYWNSFSTRARVLVIHNRINERPQSIFALTESRWKGRTVIQFGYGLKYSSAPGNSAASERTGFYLTLSNPRPGRGYGHFQPDSDNEKGAH